MGGGGMGGGPRVRVFRSGPGGGGMCSSLDWLQAMCSMYNEEALAG
jgi:hypothetical protein